MTKHDKRKSWPSPSSSRTRSTRAIPPRRVCRRRFSIPAILTVAILSSVVLVGCATRSSATRPPTDSRDACSWIETTFKLASMFDRSEIGRRAVDQSLTRDPGRLNDINQRCSSMLTPMHRLTPMQFAAWRMSDRHLPLFQILLRNGADVNLRIADGLDGLTAVEQGLVDTGFSAQEARIFSLLSNIDSTDTESPGPRYAGATALHLSAGKRGTTAVLGLLLDAGADVAALTDAGETPLHLAAGGGDAPNVLRLLGAGADPNVSDARGWTALHAAASASDDAHVIVALLEHGAEPAGRTHSGETAYDFVIGNDALQDGDAAYALEPR